MRKGYAIEDTAQRDNVIRKNPFQMPLHALWVSRALYQNFPAFQREEVWPDRFKFRLIRAVVIGAYVPDILISERTDGGSGKWVLDGQQRLQTELQFYAALEADRRGDPLPCDAQGREYFYFRLTDTQEQRFRERNIAFTEIIGATEEQIAEMFIDLQNIIPLSTAEKLWASPSKVRDASASVFTHPFFTEVYGGRKNHRQTFQMSVYPTLVEMFKPFADMNTTRLKLLARGFRDDLITPATTGQIGANMDTITKLFQGVTASAMTEAIILYQAVWLLRFIGADFSATPPGALTEWYNGVERLDKEYRIKGYMNLFSQFTQMKVQKQLWKEWLPQIVYSGAVAFADQRDAEARLQRVGSVKHVEIRTCNYATPISMYSGPPTPFFPQPVKTRPAPRRPPLSRSKAV